MFSDPPQQFASLCMLGGRLQICDLDGLGARLLDPPSKQHVQPEDRPWRLFTTPTRGSVFFSTSAILRRWDLLLFSNGEAPTTRPLPARAPHYLNFSVGPHQILFLSITSFAGHHPPKHFGRVFQDSLIQDHSLFTSPRKVQSQIVDSLSR